MNPLKRRTIGGQSVRYEPDNPQQMLHREVNMKLHDEGVKVSHLRVDVDVDLKDSGVSFRFTVGVVRSDGSQFDCFMSTGKVVGRAELLSLNMPYIVTQLSAAVAGEVVKILRDGTNKLSHTPTSLEDGSTACAACGCCLDGEVGSYPGWCAEVDSEGNVKKWGIDEFKAAVANSAQAHFTSQVAAAFDPAAALSARGMVTSGDQVHPALREARDRYAAAGEPQVFSDEELLELQRKAKEEQYAAQYSGAQGNLANVQKRNAFRDAVMAANAARARNSVVVAQEEVKGEEPGNPAQPQLPPGSAMRNYAEYLLAWLNG